MWLEWRSTDAQVMASHRPVGGDWGDAEPVDDVTERDGVIGGRVALNSMVVLPDGTAVISYQEYDEAADADFVGRVVKVSPSGTVSESLLTGSQKQWRLVADAEGDWLATARQYDRCACENYTYYSSGEAAVAFRHIAPCQSDPAISCHTVSAVRGPIGRPHDPVALFSLAAPYETVSMALSDIGLGIVLTVVSESTDILTRTSP